MVEDTRVVSETCLAIELSVEEPMKFFNNSLNIVAALSVGISLTACTPEPVEVSGDTAKQFAGKIAYVRDNRTSLCFGVAESSRMDSGGKLSYSIAMTEVPCEKVEKYLTK
jgi:hypothetical protein